MTSPALQYLLNESQDPVQVTAIVAKVKDILTQGETIKFVAVEDKVLAIDIRPDSIVLTDRRFIVYRPNILGGVKFEDSIWRDLAEVKLVENMLRATITLRTVRGAMLEVSNLPKVQARKVYAFAQQKEQEVLEERRHRDMEEKRAAAGGVLLHTGTSTHTGGAAHPPSAQASPIEDATSTLKKLKDMLDMGLIQQAEFDAKKSEILKRM